MQCASFKSKVINKYGSWDHKKSTYKCFHVDLVDHKIFKTFILVILEALAPHHFDNIHVRKCIKVSNFSCDVKSTIRAWDIPHLIKVSSSILKLWKFLFSLFNSCLCITIRLQSLKLIEFNMMLVILLSWSCKFMLQ